MGRRTIECPPWVRRQRIYSTVISTSSENFPVPTFISRHSPVVNMFSSPSSNDDYLGHSKNHDWLIDWLIVTSVLSQFTRSFLFDEVSLPCMRQLLTQVSTLPAVKFHFQISSIICSHQLSHSFSMNQIRFQCRKLCKSFKVYTKLYNYKLGD